MAKQVEGLKLYNEQKRIQIQAQLDLMDKLDDQLVQVVVMQRQIPPLAQRMLEARANVKWGENAEYQKYVKKTPIFFPKIF